MLSQPRLGTLGADRNNGGHRNTFLEEIVNCYTDKSALRNGTSTYPKCTKLRHAGVCSLVVIVHCQW